MSVCLCVCPSVRLWPRKSAITFERDVGSARNFPEHPHSWRVIFGPRALTGRARTPENGVYGKSISSGGFGPAGSCRTSSERGGRGQQNVGSGILNFCSRREKTGPEVQAGPGGAKNFGIRTFSIKGTPTDSGSRSFLVLCVRVLGPRGPARGPGGRKSKVKIETLPYRKVVRDLEIGCLTFMQLFP